MMSLLKLLTILISLIPLLEATSVIFTNDRSLRPKSICLLNSNFDMNCECARVSRNTLTISCQCKQNAQFGVRQVFFEQPETLTTALPSRYSIREFKLFNCSDVTFQANILNSPNSISEMNIENVDSLTVQETALRMNSNRKREFDLKMRNIERLVLKSQALSGTGYRRIEILNSKIEEFHPKAFYNLVSDEITISNCQFKLIPTLAFSQSEVKQFHFNQNIIKTAVKSNAFHIQIQNRLQITDNSIHGLESDALSQISPIEPAKAILEFRNNTLIDPQENSLTFNRNFNQGKLIIDSIFTNQACSCNAKDWDMSYLSTNSGFLWDEFQNVLLCHKEDTDSLVRLSEYLLTNECQLDTPRGRVKEENICTHPACQCQDETVVCDCSKSEDKEINIGFVRVASNYGLPRKTKSISINSCSKLRASMLRLSRMFKVRIENVTSLQLSSMSLLIKSQIRSGHLDFAIKNSSLDDSLESDTFCGGVFDKIVLQNVSMDFIMRKAFNSLTGVNEISLDNIRVRKEFGTEAFFNVNVKKFSLTNSEIVKVNQAAFDIRVDNLFEVKNVTMNKVEEDVFFKAKNNGTDAVMEIVNLSVTKYDPGALRIQEYFLNDNIVFTNNYIETDCDCHLHKIANKDMDMHVSKANDSTLEDITRFLHCRDSDSKFILWDTYDRHHCGELSDHNHDSIHYHYDGERLTLSRTVIAILSVVIILVIIAVTLLSWWCWSKWGKPTVAPVLPIGDDESNWKRVSFERTDSIRFNTYPTKPSTVKLTQLSVPNDTPSHLRRVSALSERESESLMVAETKTFPGFDKTLDIIQNTRTSHGD